MAGANPEFIWGGGFRISLCNDHVLDISSNHDRMSFQKIGGGVDRKALLNTPPDVQFKWFIM